MVVNFPLYVYMKSKEWVCSFPVMLGKNELSLDLSCTVYIYVRKIIKFRLPSHMNEEINDSKNKISIIKYFTPIGEQIIQVIPTLEVCTQLGK